MFIKMKILIVSGFLGAGKTTFIKHLIRKSGIRAVIMENEYGENDLDSRELEQNIPNKDDIKILEFMEGCVCCSMKDSFVNSVMTVYCALEPEFLIVEPTGVGRLSNILKNLKPLLNEKIRLLKPIVVLSPGTYDLNKTKWPELYTDQIANASVVVFTKGEREDPTILESIYDKVHTINPDCEIVSQHYNLCSKEWWLSLMELPANSHCKIQEFPKEEGFSHLTLKDVFIQSPSELVKLLEDCIRGKFGSIVRAKGTLKTKGEMLRFDLADRQYAITGSQDIKTQVVFIGKDIDKKALSRRLASKLDTRTRKLEEKALRRFTH